MRTRERLKSRNDPPPLLPTRAPASRMLPQLRPLVAIRRILMVAIIAAATFASPAFALQYLVTISPDGSRIAVAKREKQPHWDLYEGVVGSPLRSVATPSGAGFTAEFTYSPDGKELLFGSKLSRVATARSGTKRPSAVAGAETQNLETLWKLPIAEGVGSQPRRLFDHAGISNSQPLLDGSIVFMGLVRRVAKPSSPLSPPGASWGNYSWMHWRPDGSITVLSPGQHAFFSDASLIRDEAVFFVERRALDGRLVRPAAFDLNVTPLRPGAGVAELALLITAPTESEPRLQCDWHGKTCIRVTVYTKNRYFAHRLEVLRQGRSCLVNGLPDRLEHVALSRDGSTIALITRPRPYVDSGVQLALVKTAGIGCESQATFQNLP